MLSTFYVAYIVFLPLTIGVALVFATRLQPALFYVTAQSINWGLGIVSYLIYRMALVMSGAYMATPLSPQIGQMLFVALAFLELMMVCAIAPAVTAGAISGEQEKLTYEMLLATPLHHDLPCTWFDPIPSDVVLDVGGTARRQRLRSSLLVMQVAFVIGNCGFQCGSGLHILFYIF